ncbi:MAG TPA: superoxide dismutase family protein [Sphingomicrobium sp.]|nr:superoxide dismutase family protein [Sphingomicrobium sp.]
MRLSIAILTAAALAGCSSYELPRGGPAMPLINASGQVIGSVRAWQTAGGVTFRVDATQVPHGIHAVHVHAVGRCDPPNFTTAGDHWNPTGRQHGMNNPAGPHAGDLPNVEASANGVVSAVLTLPGATLSSPPGVPGALIDADGAALVIHAQADDYRTDPSGNSGARIACAVLQPYAEVRGR